MNDWNSGAPSADSVAVREAAVLDRAAAGLQATTEAERVYCATLAPGGSLRIRAAAPLGAGVPDTIDPADVPGVTEALADGRIVELPKPPLPLFDGGTTIVVPWTARGEILGVGVLAMPIGARPSDLGVLALTGALIGEALAALRECDALSRRVADLRDTAAVLDDVVTTTTEAMKILDLDGRVLRWNGGAERLYGWAEQDVIGERFPHLPEDLRLRALQDIRRIAAGGRLVQREAVATRKDGSEFVAKLAIIPINDGEGHPSGVLSIARASSLEAEETSKKDECTVMARVLKSSLTAVGGYAQLLGRNEILDDPSRRARTLSALEDRVETMNAVIDGLLLARELDSEHPLRRLESIEMAGLVADVVAQFEHDSSAESILIDYESNIAPVMIDRALVGRALTTLMSTIAAGTESGIDVHIAAVESGVVVTIGGGGVDSDTRRIAVAFATDSRGLEAIDAEDGTRELDLYVARRIVEAHGGRGSVDSTSGSLAFRIFIPLEA